MKSTFPYQAQLRTPFGMLGIHCENDVLTGITFLAPDSMELLPRTAFAKEVCAQLKAYFADNDFQFDLPLKLSGTAHQLKVWQAMRTIPRGQVRTYGELAALLYSSPRAVGQACGNNPIPIVIPCHRVVSKAGLGGFMHRADDGALDIKRWLLAHEDERSAPVKTVV
ncbi:MAG: methylated-DNA--[protein]-cysteine S-methyltransferase [Gallionellaceae bacterium]|jgi:methylated-DNA-[protein]-cysteine S-methyltransferase